MSNILYEKDSTGQYAIFKLNRPDRLNALNSRMMIEITEALTDFENDKQMMNTYKVAEDIALDWSKFSVFHPLPGTPEFKSLDEESKETYDFSAINYQTSFDDARNYKTEIEKQMSNSLMHEEKKDNYISQSHKKISQLAYIKNLEINFIRNKNLNGKNVDRAIKDYEGIVKFIEGDHAIAHYCLTKAYSYKGQNQKVKKHANKIFINRI